MKMSEAKRTRKFVYIELSLKGAPFKVWNDRGTVHQSGLFGLPEVMKIFGNSKAGRLEAGAYIDGLVDADRLLRGLQTAGSISQPLLSPLSSAK